MKNFHIFGAILVFISANLCLVFGDDSNSLKEADELPEIKELPNPFAFSNGSLVQSKEDWERQRAERILLNLLKQ